MDTIIIPNLESHGTIAEQIICMLTEEWPLTTKGVFSRLFNNHNKCSIQATYKALKKLQDEKLIEKNGQYYRLNTEWLKRINCVSTEIIQKYENAQVFLKALP